MNSQENSDWEARLRSGELDNGVRLLLKDLATGETGEDEAPLTEAEQTLLASYKNRRELLRNSVVWVAKNGGSKLQSLLNEGQGELEIEFSGPIDPKTNEPMIARCQFQLSETLTITWDTPSHGVPIDLVLVNSNTDRCQPFAMSVELTTEVSLPRPADLEANRRATTHETLALGAKDFYAGGTNGSQMPEREFEVEYASGRGELEVSCAKRRAEDCVVAIVEVGKNDCKERHVVTLESRIDSPNYLIAAVPIPEASQDAAYVFVKVDEVTIDDLPALSRAEFSAWTTSANFLAFPIRRLGSDYLITFDSLLPETQSIETLDLVIRASASEGE